MEHLAVQDARPRLRGVSHHVAFYVAAAAGAALVLDASGERSKLAAAVFATSVCAMFGASALYHRVLWPPARRRWMRRLDHAAIYLLIAGTYTPVGLLALSGAWRVTVLAIVWSGSAIAILLKLLWTDAPKWVAAATGLLLGWVAVVALPELWTKIGAGGTGLLVGGGLLYSVGAVVYAFRRPDPAPGVFGYHEVFHALVIAAVACQYAAIAFFVVPG